MKIVIRADSNSIVSMGHVMRCLSIADAFKAKENEVIFVCASEDPVELINKRGFEAVVLNTAFDKMEEELPLLVPLFEKEGKLFCADLLIVDSYYVTDGYLSKLKEYAFVAYLDDYANNAVPCDALINYNIYGDLTDYKGLFEKAGLTVPKLILGAEYAPLRKEFLKATPNRVKRFGKISVLVSTGGSDGLGIAKAIADRMVKEPIKNVFLNILVGPFSKDREYLEELSKTYPKLMTIYSGITDMPSFLKKSNIAVSAAGSTSYELCKMQLPTILFSIADNQNLINKTFADKNIMDSAGNAESNKEECLDNIFSFIKKASKDYGFRKEKAKKMAEVPLGNGAFRIADKLTEYIK